MVYYLYLEDDDQDSQDVYSYLTESISEIRSEEEVCNCNDLSLESTLTTIDEEVCTPDDPVNTKSSDQLVEASAVKSKTEQMRVDTITSSPKEKADDKSIIF